MPPKRKQCSCKEHGTYSKGKDFFVFKNDGKKHKERVYLKPSYKMVYFFQNSTYISHVCVFYAEENVCKQKKITIREYLNDFFLEEIDSGMFSEENCKRCHILL